MAASAQRHNPAARLGPVARLCVPLGYTSGRPHLTSGPGARRPQVDTSSPYTVAQRDIQGRCLADKGVWGAMDYGRRPSWGPPKTTGCLVAYTLILFPAVARDCLSIMVSSFLVDLKQNGGGIRFESVQWQGPRRVAQSRAPVDASTFGRRSLGSVSHLFLLPEQRGRRRHTFLNWKCSWRIPCRLTRSVGSTRSRIRHASGTACCSPCQKSF